MYCSTTTNKIYKTKGLVSLIGQRTVVNNTDVHLEKKTKGADEAIHKTLEGLKVPNRY